MNRMSCQECDCGLENDSEKKSAKAIQKRCTHRFIQKNYKYCDAKKKRKAHGHGLSSTLKTIKKKKKHKKL